MSTEKPQVQRADLSYRYYHIAFLAVCVSAAAGRTPEGIGLAFGFGGYVAFGELGAFAEEELLHLLFHDFL
jgi:hypothetical protein